MGAGLNKVVKLQDIVQGVDIYFGSHNHQSATGEQTVYMPSMQKGEMVVRKVYFVDCGSFLTYDGSYGEQFMYRPTALGAPRVRLIGTGDRREILVMLGDH